MAGQAATIAGGGRLLSSNRKGFTLAGNVTSIAMLNIQRRFGFTLAEVLVTLGIIGVVAALTMPSVIANYQKQETVQRLKKVYTVMSNAIKMSESVNGEMADWEFPTSHYDSNFYLFFRKYYTPYLQIAEECTSANCFKDGKYEIVNIAGKPTTGIYIANYFIKLSDGTYLYFLPNTPNGYIWMLADINGHKKPNRLGRDIFVFDIYNYPFHKIRKNYHLKFWCDYKDIDALKNDTNYGCNKNADNRYAGFNCGALIQKNGWEIPEDYPWK